MPCLPSLYRGRFAPSPTGPLHFGSLVAAVGSYLEAKTRGGEWRVRMEDLDRPRVAPGAAEAILRALEAFGFEWDAEVVYQSRRQDAYHAALHLLEARGALYACACSRREIADSALRGIEGPVYPGTCRRGVARSRRPRALRVRTHPEPVAFDDAIQGFVEQRLERDVGDFVVYRADHSYAYQLAVVVDDALQGITDVVRGADLLASTPRQIHLQRLLGLPTPRYAHLPVAVNAAGEKLSKQTRAAPVDATRGPALLVAALAFLGQCPPAALARADVGTVWQWARSHWRLERVPRKPAAPAYMGTGSPL
ncbi:tRNA glutamyl-Q(34) synthetase GluQRS [Pelomicrobium methylotrophicum]|uniref:Glutamyl-Q tRNA(Asp) synthetase n=1 Tax=Pelomicrobium methylotrophicum TaxID=2602750 RepID=A0A5C7EL28_9PROT|nr:tRNA glutamyl-Q(34) synthetase GluQRS [Pelomicrobium methylotrophicum]TXF13030.1 tRNA glutamyl-Q(34) synthetase GluQRS [Pelomicrobium methylotrophicum]